MKKGSILVVAILCLYLRPIIAQSCNTPIKANTASCIPPPASSPYGGPALDIYGGLLSGHLATEATGLVHVKKINGHWVYYTALGNPMWEISFDNARLTTQLGVDIDGHGTDYFAAQKYAIGKGPKDGFTDAKMRWAYYTRAMARSWGFTGTGGYSYYPVIPNVGVNNWPIPTMGTMPSNLMTYVITHNNSASALKAGAKNIYASVWAQTGPSPYFADPFDPNFAASAYAVAHTLIGHNSDPLVRYILTGQVDQLRGLLGTHLHIGFVVAASAPNISSDLNAYGGTTVYYSDTTNYAKYALRDYLASTYANVAALNTAWGTHYTTFDNAGGWGTGTGFLDENGTGLCSTWNHVGPSYPCANAHMQGDLDAFATQLVRKYYKTLYTNYRAVTQYMLQSTDYADSNWRYALAGAVDTDGTPLVDIVSLSSLNTANQVDIDAGALIYSIIGRPIIFHEQEMANNDSAVSMKGTITAVTSLGTGTECGVASQGVQIFSEDADFWWWNGATNGVSMLIPWSSLATLKFSSVPYYKTDGKSKYEYYFRRFIDAHNVIVCPGNFGAANRTMLLSFLKPGDTFERIEESMWENTPDTQEARGDRYANVLSSVWNRKAANGDHYGLGIEYWAWWDNNWIHSLYYEVENYGLVTPYGNAYDGVQAVKAHITDQWGFPAGGESANYGNFIGKVAAANQSIYKSLASGMPWVLTVK